MATVGDTIDILTTDDTLLSNATWTSKAFVMVEYNTLSLTMYASTNTTITVYWSGDAHYWDFGQVYTADANVASNFSVVTLNKWVYITVHNSDVVNQSFMRFTTYATVADTAVKAILVGPGPKIPPSVSVTNSFDYNNLQSQHIESWDPQFYYSFQGLTGGDSFPDGIFPCGYLDLRLQVEIPDTTSLRFQNNEMFIWDGPVATTTVYQSSFMKLYPGIGGRCIFSAAFRQWNNIGSTNPKTSWLTIGSAYYDPTTSEIIDGCAFGMIGNKNYNASVTDNHIFGISYWHSTIRTDVLQASWNVDPCDGSGTMPVITDWSDSSAFCISYSLNSNILFYVQNPNSPFQNKYTLVHQIKFDDTTFGNIFTSNRMGMLAQHIQGTGSSFGAVGHGWLAVDNFALFQEITKPIPPSAHYSIGFQLPPPTQIPSTKVQAPLLFVKNLPTITYTQTSPTGTFIQKNISIIEELGLLSFGGNSTSSVNIYIYAGATVGHTGYSYVNSQYSPLAYILGGNSAGGITGSDIIDTGQLLYNTVLATNSGSIIDLAPYKLHLYPEGSLLVMYTSSLGTTFSMNALFNEYR